jgi:flagellar basal-body rod protein FlgC
VFEAIGTAGTGLQSYHTWLDVIADNVANVNDTTSPSGNVFRTHYVQVAENSGADGVHVASVTDQTENGVLQQDPTNPIADSQGYVRHADVNLSEQMGDMIMAQRAFQANASMIDRAKDAYQAALNIGKGV